MQQKNSTDDTPSKVPLKYDIRPIQQGMSECLQTATAQLLKLYEPKITVETILDEVPVYVENGERIGTSPGHVAAFLQQKGYQVTAHIFDTELFDRSWDNKSSSEVVQALEQRQKHIPDNAWLKKYHHILVDGWRLFSEAGGAFSFENLDSTLLYESLNRALCSAF